MLVALLAVVPMAAASGDPELVGIDPKGDAREWGTRGLAREACAEFCPPDPVCVRGICVPDPAPDNVSHSPNVQVVPAPAALDVVALYFSDTPEYLVVDLHVASLDAQLTGAVSEDLREGAVWNVCWADVARHNGDPCGSWVRLAVGLRNGVRFERASYNLRHAPDDPHPCNDYNHCWWSVKHEIVPGTPGVVRWFVPRALLPFPEAGATLGAPKLESMRTWSPTEIGGAAPSGLRFDANYSVSAGGPANVSETRPWAWEPEMRDFLVTDSSENGRDYPLKTPYATAGLPPGGSFTRVPSGDVPPVVGDRNNSVGDIEAVGIVETPTKLTVAVQLALVGEGPDHGLAAFLSTPSGRMYWLSSRIADGGRTWGGVRTNGTVFAVPVNVSGVIAPGPHGWVNISVDRREVPGLQAGRLLSSFSVLTHRPYTPDVPRAPNPYVDAGWGSGYWIDYTGPLPPYKLRFDTQVEEPLAAESMGARILQASAAGAGLLALGAVATTTWAVGARSRRARVAAGADIGRLAPGALFAGRYEVLRALGRGAQGETFLARDRALGREVVLKRLAGDLRRDAVALDRFRRETRIASALQHPNIVTVYDTLTAGDEAVLVMEHARGGTLADRLLRGPLPEDEAVRIALDALAALDELHARGIVHRDVKPSNVLLDERGRAKLGDFGVATDLVSGETVGVGRSPPGTMGYMAPEQARGLPAAPKSDLYALAATLYEALSGRPPIQVEGLPDFEARSKVLHDAPRLPLPAAGRAVNAALARGLAKDPDARFPDAAAMARALRGIA